MRIILSRYRSLAFSLLLCIPSLQALAQTNGMSVGTNATPDEMLDVNGAIKIGNDFTNSPTSAPVGGAGTIRWNGTE